MRQRYKKISSSRKTNIKGGPFDYFGGILFNYYLHLTSSCKYSLSRNVSWLRKKIFQSETFSLFLIHNG